MLKIKFLKAFNGDCILLTLRRKDDKERLILIDGGIRDTYKAGKKGKVKYGDLKELADHLHKEEKMIDLLILTHVDDDHIAGILEWFENDADAFKVIKEVWFNSGALIAEHFTSAENPDLDPEFILPTLNTDTSILQGIRFGTYIQEKGIWKKEIFMQGKEVKWNGAEFKFLSPNEQKLEKLLNEWKKVDPPIDTSARTDDYGLTLKYLIANDKFEEDVAFPNGSSIAFIFSFEDYNYLFLGDAHPSVIIEGLMASGFSKQSPIKCELVKLAHHGSKGNTNIEMLELIDANVYVISTNGQGHLHPHKQLLARLINCKPKCQLFFNYKDRMDKVFLAEDFDYKSFAISETPEQFLFE